MKKLLQKMSDNGWNLARKIILTAGVVLLLISTIITVAAYTRNIIRYDNGFYLTFKNKVKSIIPPSSKVICSNQIQPHFIGHAKSGHLWKVKDLDSDYDYIVIYLRGKSLSIPDSILHNYMAGSNRCYDVNYEDSNFRVYRVTGRAE